MASVLSKRTQFVLDESRIPRAWYNIAADLPFPMSPPLHPGTMQPIGPADLAPLFPMALILQEVSGEREIEIPDPVREAYMLYRPSPLHRAHRLEKALDTPAHIYYKYEGVQPGRQPQAQHGDPAGVLQPAGGRHAARDRDRRRPVGERAVLRGRDVRARGQGLHGPRELRPEAVPADPDGDVRGAGRGEPQRRDELRRAVLAATPDSPGSLGMAISEAVEDAATRDDTKYSLGSVLNHVLLHQTVVGLEALEQMAMAGEEPDVIIACAGGGSNFAGLTFPFVGRKLRGEAELPGHRRGAGGGALAHPRASMPTTSATPATWRRS